VPNSEVFGWCGGNGCCEEGGEDGEDGWEMNFERGCFMRWLIEWG
jgi:hypothetical protein